MIPNSSQAGFTIVEVIVALVISGLFIIGIYSASSGTLQVSTESSQKTQASNAAYANLRKYANGLPITFPCSASTTSLMSSTASISGLPGPILQTVTATATHGCSASDPYDIIQIVSTVRYGPQNKQVAHATYVTEQ